MKDTDKNTVRGFNLFNKFQETEYRVFSGFSILIIEDIPPRV